MSELDSWDYELPEHHIARYPAERRDGSRLLHIPLSDAPLTHQRFPQLDQHLRPGDALVINNTRVMAGRVHGRRATGGAVELLILEPGPGPVTCMARPGRRLKLGEAIELAGGATATLLERTDDGLFRFEFDRDVPTIMNEQGELPLPPYFGRTAEASDEERYQTVYAGPLGAAAAPTAGLHFTQNHLDRLRDLGVHIVEVTLHVGIGTFRPLDDEDLARGELHQERWQVSAEAAAQLEAVRAAGGRVIAVGTTSVRTLESATPEGSNHPKAGQGHTRLFIRPGYRFRAVDGLITNFHLPRSSLLMLVAALCGKERLFSAYNEAIAHGYRFYSYGDAMLLL